MPAAPSYVEHPPPPALRAMVECIWTRQPPPTGMPPVHHRVLPDGCADLILELGRAASADGAPGGLSCDLGAAYFVGAMTRPIVVRPDGPTWFVGVRCRRGAARALLGVPATELTDQRAELTALWPAGNEVLRDALCAAIGEDRTTPDQAASTADGHTTPAGPPAPVGRLLGALWRALQRRFDAEALPPSDLRCALNRIDDSDGTIRVDALCGELGITRQHLARRFATHVGVTPKTYARIVRMRRVIARAGAERDLRWSRLALDFGYADQAHLTSDFTRLVGVPPARWLAGG
ncbi:MAG TPA: AraC family transcriptional regulator [Gemmatimonadaceae bacterium]|nr:AraC family transcriptional regulator [Gemmatimonadaceae bacterium]